MDESLNCLPSFSTKPHILFLRYCTHAELSCTAFFVFCYVEEHPANVLIASMKHFQTIPQLSDKAFLVDTC